MRNGTYHRDIWLPFSLPDRLPLPKYSQHAKARARSKGFKLPDALSGTYELIEATFVDGTVTKWVIRGTLTADYDIVLVVHPDGFVRTAWLNHRFDTHKTLDRSKYVGK